MAGRNAHDIQLLLNTSTASKVRNAHDLQLFLNTSNTSKARNAHEVILFLVGKVPQPTLTGTFTYADGTPVANGKLILQLSQDCVSVNTGQVVSGVTVEIDLDQNGTVIGTPALWAQKQLVPSTTVYFASLFNNIGVVVWNNTHAWTIPLASTVNLSTLADPSQISAN